MPGGFTLYTDSLDVGATLSAGSGTWSAVSDVNVKKNFNPINSRDLLERLADIPVQEWRYKDEEESIRHLIGPTSQDFYGAFGLGIDDRHIATIDADGVSMAGILALYEIVQNQEKTLVSRSTPIDFGPGSNEQKFDSHWSVATSLRLRVGLIRDPNLRPAPSRQLPRRSSSPR